MKTTVEVPDSLYRRVKARAAERGLSVKTFMLDALQEKLAEQNARPKETTGWRAVFGAGRAEDIAAIQQIIESEFSRVDPEGWQ